MPASLPTDPFGTLAGAAVGVHEMFRSFVAAGFTEDQALVLVGGMLSAMAAAAAGNADPDG